MCILQKEDEACMDVAKLKPGKEFTEESVLFQPHSRFLTNEPTSKQDCNSAKAYMPHVYKKQVPLQIQIPSMNRRPSFTCPTENEKCMNQNRTVHDVLQSVSNKQCQLL